MKDESEEERKTGTTRGSQVAVSFEFDGELGDELVADPWI